MDPELKKHLLRSLEANIRFDGRKLDEFRDIKIEVDVSKSAEGSARVHIGKTDVIVGVKMAVEAPYLDSPEQGNLMVNAELLPLSSPDFEHGPPSREAIELARIVDRGIRESKAIDTHKLCVKVGEKVWAVMIDVCTINADGNLIDASALGALAALKNARFPHYDEEKNEIDYNTKTSRMLPIIREPIAVTAYKSGSFIFVDPLPDEEKLYDTRLTVTCTKEGNVCSLQKGGEIPLAIADIDKMVELAIRKSKELRACLSSK